MACQLISLTSCQGFKMLQYCHVAAPIVMGCYLILSILGLSSHYIGDRSFTVTAPKLCNSLPFAITSSPSVTNF